MKLALLIVFLSFYFLFLNLDKTAAAGLSLGISSPLIKIQTSPPATISEPITIENHGDETVTLNILLKPFSSGKGELGEVVYDLKNDPLIFKYIQVLDNNEKVDKVVIAPEQNKTLNLNIDIPKNESISDYYFSVLFISEKDSEQPLNQSSILGGIGTNVLLSVKNTAASTSNVADANAAEEKVIGKIVEFSAPSFLENGPVPFEIRFKNESKHFTTTDGEILIKNIFGKTIGQVKVPAVNILAGTTRKENVLLDNGLMLGLYTATLSVSISDNEPVLVKTIRFFVIPVHVVLISTAIFIIIFVILRRLRTHRG